jgi:DNA polymerase-3 subunit epsilon
MFGLIARKKEFSINEQRPISDVRYVVVDTELTGLDENRDSIVSIGAVRMTGGKIDLGNTFYRLVSPRTELTAESVVIHEITPSDVELSPSIGPVLEEFLEFCGEDVLVGHFISIDLSFLNRELKRLRKAMVRSRVVDTFSVYEWLRRRGKSRDCFATPLTGYRLYDIARCFDVPVNGAHNAIMDAYATAQLFQRFLPLLAESGAESIGDLLKIGIPFEGGDGFGLTGEITNF